MENQMQTEQVKVSIEETEQMKEILSHLKSPNNDERELCEKKIESMRYDLRLYKCLSEIAFNVHNSLEIRTQSLLVMKNLIRVDLNKRKKAFDLNSLDKEVPTQNTFNEILDFVKLTVIDFLSKGNFYTKPLISQIKEIILIITDKLFPDKWEELIECFVKFFAMQIQAENLMNEKFYDVIAFMLTVFYGIIKQFSKKKSPMTKNKFYPYKEKFVDCYVSYYENFINVFNMNIQNFIDVKITAKCLHSLMLNDKIMISLIEISYNQSEFHKDKKLLYMIKILMQRAHSVIEHISAIVDRSLLEILHHNIYKIIKNCAMLQTSNPIIFYSELSNYVDILRCVISHCEVFTEETAKATFFALAKIIGESSYKDATANDNDCDFSFAKTPEKKRISRPLQSGSANISIHLFTSPTKYRNFDSELRISCDCYNESFKEEKVNEMINYLINKCAFIYKKESDSVEIEILSEIEDENSNSQFDAFSTNLLTFQALYKNLLETIVINFTSISMKYIKENLSKLYSFDISNQNLNFLAMDSLFNFVNLLPFLYKNRIISINDMIDSSKFISFMEKLLTKSDLLLRRYILTLSKWSVILISNETVFQYFNNLILFISNTKNDYILIESCLCMKSIIDTIDKQMSNKNESINTIVDKETFLVLLKSKINWGNLLILVTNILGAILPKIQSSELIVSLVKFFTSLIQKSHYQNSGEILTVITKSKLMEIMSNCKDEFTENVYIEMYKTLIISFDDSFEVAQLAMSFGSALLRKNVSVNNLNFILYIIKAVKATEEIKNLFFDFLKNNIQLFMNNTMQNLNSVLVSIIEEIVLLDKLNENDISTIIEMISGKYKISFDTMNTFVSQMRNNSNLAQSMLDNQRLILEDLIEVKVSYLKAFNSILLFFTQVKNKDITLQYKKILLYAFTETKMIYDNNQILSNSISYISELLQLITRTCIYNFDVFKESLIFFLSENNLNIDVYLDNYLNIIKQNFFVSIGRLNCLFICNLLPLLSIDFLRRNEKNIIDSFLDIIYVDYKKKEFLSENQKEENSNMELEVQKAKNNLINGYDYFNNKKKIIIRMSERKEELAKKDKLMAIDLSMCFVQAITRLLSANNLTVEQYISQTQSGGDKLKEIFGFGKKQIN